MAPAPRARLGAPRAITGSVARAHPARSQRRAILASAERIVKGDSDMLRRLSQGWQTRAFLYYEQCGEIWYAAQFYARALAKLELAVKRIDPETGSEEDVTDSALQDYVLRIQDPGGGRANLLGAYGRLMFLTGEGYLLCTNPRQDQAYPDGSDEPDVTAEAVADDQTEQWEFLSTDELRPTGDGSFTRFKAPSMNAEDIRLNDDDNWEPVEGKAVAYRFWRRHPRYSILADAPMRGVLDLCEELLLLTMAVRARAVSRVAGSGILLLPDEISPAPPDPIGDEDPVEDVFLSDLTEAMVEPIKDQGAASAVVPFVVRGPAEFLKEMRLLELSDPTKLYPETGLRTECIHRIAIGIDMPPAALEGVEDANHWSAWSIDEQTWKAHLQPIAQMFVDDLTAAYLRPAMAADGIDNPSQYVIAYDASAVINHPDRTKDAKDLWDRLAISDEALRDANGFDDDDSPDEAEWLRRAGFLMHDSSMAAYGIPGVRGVIEPQPGELEKVGTQGGEVGAPTGTDATPAESAGTQAPTPPAEQQAQPATAIAAAAGAEVAGAARVALMRCRDLAGARIRSRCAGNEDASALIDQVPNALVAAGLGRARVSAVYPGTTSRELVRGGAAPMVAALADFGMSRGEAVALAAAVERHAAQTLYSANPTRLELNGNGNGAS